MSRIPQAEVYFASPRSEAAREVFEMFGPYGTFEDIHLGCADTDNTSGQLGWVPAEAIVRAIRRREILQWSPAEDAITSLIRHDTERGGGIINAQPELAQVRAAMIAFGENALDQKREQDRRAVR
jgi:hypothetical protein